MNHRNAKYTEQGLIDCEIEHPDYGWIPTTLSADDDETAELFATVVSAGDAAVYQPPVLSQEQQIHAINSAVEAHLAALVASKKYTERTNYAKYVGYTNQFRADAENLGAYEASVWHYAEVELAKLAAGTRTAPTPEEFLLELPVFIDI